MNENWFIIKNLEDFINASRQLVFQNFGNKNDSSVTDILSTMSLEDKAEMDSVLSYKESYSIIKSFLKKQTNKKTKEHRYILNEDIYMSIITSLNDRLVSNLLNSLVNKGLIETAYDVKSNDFIFWIKDNEQNQDKKSEAD